MTKYEPGTFCWVDVCVTDTTKAKPFYTELFGWEPTDTPAGQGVYTMFRKNGRNVCGLHPSAQEAPPYWLSYISVENTDASAGKAVELGGEVIVPPFDAMEAGRSAVLRDPAGAVFAVWQPKQHIGADVVNEPGALCWNELLTSDITAAEAFYGDLFGWTAHRHPSPAGGEYTEFKSGHRLAGGMLEIQASWGEMPPNWVVYFAVESTDATIAKARSLGGRPLFPAMNLPGVGRICYLSDTEDAVFAIVQLLPGSVG